MDSPIQRERHTGIPIIPGSSLKGVISDLWNDETHKRTEEGKKLFGEDDNSANAEAGKLLIGEARVLAFPVRSAKGMFAWLTSPVVLRRLKRDVMGTFEVPEIQGEKAMAFDAVKLKDDAVVLEEYSFEAKEKPPAEIVKALSGLVKDDPVWCGIDEQLVIVSDEMFQYFCEQACDVVTRIKVDDTTGTVAKGALFNQEQVPSETLFYTTVMAQKEEYVEMLKSKLEKEEWLQFGGDASIGLGFCTVNCREVL